jgi:hypothetical protein
MTIIQEENIKNALIKFATEITAQIKAGKSIKEIRQWSFDKRENGENIPYLAGPNLVDTDQDALLAQPTKKQKDLYEFFELKAHNARRIRRYNFYVYENKVTFYETAKVDKKFQHINLLK